jgi:hypothetical protein
MAYGPADRFTGPFLFQLSLSLPAHPILQKSQRLFAYSPPKKTLIEG